MKETKRPIFNFFASLGDKLLPGKEYEPAGARILVIEHKSDIRELVRSVLSSAGYEVLEAENRDKAIRAIQSSDHPALILYDLEMPKLKCEEVINYLKLLSLPIIIMSRSADIPTAEFLSRGRAVDFLVKPINPKDLRRAVDKAVAASAKASVADS